VERDNLLLPALRSIRAARCGRSQARASGLRLIAFKRGRQGGLL